MCLSLIGARGMELLLRLLTCTFASLLLVAASINSTQQPGTQYRRHRAALPITRPFTKHQNSSESTIDLDTRSSADLLTRPMLARARAVKGAVHGGAARLSALIGASHSGLWSSAAPLEISFYFLITRCNYARVEPVALGSASLQGHSYRYSPPPLSSAACIIAPSTSRAKSPSVESPSAMNQPFTARR